MPAPRFHPDQVPTDADLVRRLLAQQHPRWAHLPVRAVDSFGTDHDVYRLGDDLAARLPKVAFAAGQAVLESSWLPRLAPHLPVALPEHLAAGRPGCGYPFAWSVCRWLPGRAASPATDDTEALASDLAGFLGALHAAPTTGAPARRAGARGGPLAERDAQVRAAVAELGDRVDARAVLRVWEEALDAPGWDGPEVWVHGDPLPGNLLVRDGRLSAVIDWGALAVGDPACDLQGAWNLLGAAHRARLRDDLAVDEAQWLRGRGWVVAQAVVALPYYWGTNPGIVAQGLRALGEVLAPGD
ncbi:aminoglycoside phosphotransferase family protein [Kineococcus terrestris]|uniref:aminoglycoside phosphotransferase family protein n=1 Tax=Kineococcus terrestris TaxID=2044856 RepID=UPI0034DAC929